MSRDRGPHRLHRHHRNTLTAAALALLALPASGCVVVHGEREVLPATSEAEAAEALRKFTTAYNKADKAYDSSFDAAYVTGPLGDMDEARLNAGHVNHPAGNPAHTPLKFADVEYTIPEKAGWPRWFLADARANRGDDDRWLMVFTRDGLDERWEVSYLTVVDPGKVPEFKLGEDGFAEALPADSPELAVPPEDLSRYYATYLEDGGNGFAPGPHTTDWRAEREKKETRPGLATQYMDEPLTGGDYDPVALRTADGGALVFFTTRHFVKQTAAAGASVPTPNKNVLALTTGEIKQSLTMEFVSNQVALTPERGAGDAGVNVLGRIQGLTSAKGE
jgi:hypothetical protein